MKNKFYWVESDGFEDANTGYTDLEVCINTELKEYALYREELNEELDLSDIFSIKEEIYKTFIFQLYESQDCSGPCGDSAVLAEVPIWVNFSLDDDGSYKYIYYIGDE